MTLPKVLKNGTEILYPSQYIDLINSIRDKRLKLTVEILFLTGLRYSELDQVATSFNQEKGYLNIISTKEEAVLSDRWVKLSPAALRAVTEWIEGNYTPMRRTSFNEVIKPYTDNVGVKLTAKTSRKTHEIWRLQIKDDSLQVCIDIGHSPKTAYQHYCKNVPYDQGDIDSINRIFGLSPKVETNIFS